MKHFWMPVLALGWLTGCASAPPATPANKPQGWQAPRDLASLEGRWQQVDAGKDQPYRLEFAAGRLHASAGCNGMGSVVSLENGLLKTGAMMSTLMACPPPLDQRERSLSQLLSAQPRLTLQGNRLQLQAGSDQLEFQRETTHDGS
ncbi:META domain-containing protein [Aquitalea aquatica]|uniref:META domain-containing protein n=1 Tax=Aquitalea aquatica TaxID=3044273 RepID=A0A838Y8K8_9NEIS|nr:META domain-containing protein [Aquitalea magnusonii]MBA4709712.1 META domain-containing protein [Aquitalea magnusonii]